MLGQQPMFFLQKRKTKVVKNMVRLLGRVTVRYDGNLDKPNMMDYIKELSCHMQR